MEENPSGGKSRRVRILSRLRGKNTNHVADLQTSQAESWTAEGRLSGRAWGSLAGSRVERLRLRPAPGPGSG